MPSPPRDPPTQADAIARVLLAPWRPQGSHRPGAPRRQQQRELLARCGLLRDLGLDPATFLAVTKPYAARRTIATARRRWPRKTVAVTSQQVTFDQYLAGDIPAHQSLSHLAGEALRLEAYAATGLIDPGDPVPGSILRAARDLQAAGFNTRAIGNTAG